MTALACFRIQCSAVCDSLWPMVVLDGADASLAQPCAGAGRCSTPRYTAYLSMILCHSFLSIVSNVSC